LITITNYGKISPEGGIAVEIIPVSNFKATCLSLLSKVKQTGKPILVTCKGEPIALITPLPSPPKLPSWLGEITGDILSPALEEGRWEILSR